MWNLKKKDTNELSLQSKNRLIDLKKTKTNLQLPRGKGGRHKLGV